MINTKQTGAKGKSFIEVETIGYSSYYISFSGKSICRPVFQCQWLSRIIAGQEFIFIDRFQWLLNSECSTKILPVIIDCKHQISRSQACLIRHWQLNTVLSNIRSAKRKL